MPHVIGITTAQNVTIEYEVANLGDRILAFIIDMLIKIAYAIIVFTIFLSALSDISYEILLVLGFVLALPFILYSLLFEIFNNGQTPGKRSMNIKVVSIEGKEVSFSGYFLRWLFRIIDINMLSGILAVLVIAFSEKGQRIGDIVGNTSVISLKKRSSIKQTVFETVAEDYIPMYPSVINLRNEDITIIKEVLKNRSEDAFQLKMKLGQKIEDVLVVNKVGSSEEFLKRVIADFNYYEQSE